MHFSLLLAGIALVLVSVPHINATHAGGVSELLDVGNADADDFKFASRRHLQSSLGDWADCTDSKQCTNGCCSSKYIRLSRDNDLKCTPVGGFKPSEGCVGGVLKGDWELCSTSSECANGCCSRTYSDDGKLKCTPLTGGYRPDICVGGPPAPTTPLPTTPRPTTPRPTTPPTSPT
jgi:hypothetical protein